MFSLYSFGTLLDNSAIFVFTVLGVSIRASSEMFLKCLGLERLILSLSKN